MPGAPGNGAWSKNMYKLTKEQAQSWDRCLGDGPRPTDDDRITVEEAILSANGATICYPGCEPWRGAKVEMVRDIWGAA